MIDKLVKIINESKRIVFFTGAGVSTESGIPDFRSSDGIFLDKTKYIAEEIVSRSFFEKDPSFFYKFYKDKMIHLNARPNASHLGMSKLEDIGKVSAIVTQNIDNLHQLAGSREVLELHGSIMRNYCTACNTFYGVEKIVESEPLPLCDKCSSIIKPDVILYEEALDPRIMDSAIKKISESDTIIISGTSLLVYPAAGMIRHFMGKNLVIINKSKTKYDGRATLIIDGYIGQVMKEVMEKLNLEI